MKSLQNFPDDARVWIFTSNRKVHEAEQAELSAEIQEFLNGWAAHGTPLMAGCDWLNTYQVVIALDQSQAGASGCSIDALTRFMRSIGEKHSIDWFDRMFLIIDNAGEIERISFFDAGEYPQAGLFDHLVQRLGEIRSGWPVIMRESRYAHLIR